MKKQFILSLLIFCFALLPGVPLAKNIQPCEFMVLCYHSVPPSTRPHDAYGVPQNLFVEQMEYLYTHGYHAISIDDIIKAREGKYPLPAKSVLLTFDDAYISYYEFVVPVLEIYGYPSLLAVVGSWIDNPPDALAESLMTWDQIKTVARNDGVEIASHTYNLHRGIQYNPQGNMGPAVSVRAYYPDDKRYETEQEYTQRLRVDFDTQKALLKEKLGLCPRGLAWPYGRYDQISVSMAQKKGLLFCFTLEEGVSKTDQIQNIRRILVKNEPMKDFIAKITEPEPKKPSIRAVQVDLDLIYDPESYKETDQNLGQLIERLVAMNINTVFLQAFCDPEGTGNIESVYFHNRVLPVTGDIFSHAVHQLFIRKMKVYAWMPTLSFVLPDKELGESLRILENKNGVIGKSRSAYQRLTPFSPKVIDTVRKIYEDLGAHSQISGVLFQDDAYLTDQEDYHPLALKRYKERFGPEISMDDLKEDPELAMKWARYKTEVLMDLTKILEKAIKKYRPDVKIARNVYANVMANPQSEKWFAQNYWLFLNHYDQVVVMAYPQMEKIKSPLSWLEGLVNYSNNFPQGLNKTVFKIQTYDWAGKKWVKEKCVLSEIRTILASRGRHIAYYPDNYLINKPNLEKIKLEMSTQTYPFMP